MARHEIHLDLSAVDLAGLHSDEDVRREARRLLPAALEDLGQALAEAAWAGVRERTPGPPIRLPGQPGALSEFVVEAGRRYKRHAPAVDRAALEEVIVNRLWAAKALAAAGTKDDPGSTVTPGRSHEPSIPGNTPDPRPVVRTPMRTLEYTLPDGTTGTATPEDVAKAVEALLMDGTMVMDSDELTARLDQLRGEEARFTAIVRAVVERAREQGVVPGQAPGPDSFRHRLPPRGENIVD